MFGFLRDLGYALRNKGLRALAGEIPFVGSLVDVVADALQRRRARNEKAELREDIEVIARIASADEAKRVAAEIAREVADREPLEIQLQLENYLTQVPQALRQSLRRPEDPSGKTVGARLDESPEHIAQMLPQRLPRFKAGDKPECLRGEWLLEELLGTGGFGEVWKARHADFDGTVAAIKFCLDPTVQDRLLKHEGQLINQVMKHGSHPGIVPLQDASLRSDPPWLRYEYIPGGDLLLLFAKLKPLPIAERLRTALPIFQKLCDTVGYFHRLNPPVVHRDLKPSNILLMKQKGGYRMRIADFGISQLASQQALDQVSAALPHLSMAGTLRGAHSPLYASPQHRKGEAADVRDDVYSLGVILYQLLVADPTAERPGGSGWKIAFRNQGISVKHTDLLEACFDDLQGARPDDGTILAERFLSQSAPAQGGSATTASAPPSLPSPSVAAGVPEQPQSQGPKLDSIPPVMEVVVAPRASLERRLLQTKVKDKDRVFALALAWGFDSRIIMDICKGLGIDTKSELASLEKEQAEAVKRWLEDGTVEGRTKAGIFTVDPSGGGDFKTLHEAVERTAAGAVIRLVRGDHHLAIPLALTKPVTLIGTGIDATRIVCADEGYVAQYSADGRFSATDLAFIHEGERWANILCVDGGEVSITHCRFVGAVNDGDKGMGGDGLVLSGTTQGQVQACVMNGNQIGIVVTGEAQPTLEGNTCEGNELSGILVCEQAKPILKRNTCNGNLSGIAYWGGAGLAWNNTCAGNDSQGIWVCDPAEPRLEGNICQGNKSHGIEYRGGAGGTVRLNACHDNGGDGIRVSKDAYPILEGNRCSGNKGKDVNDQR